MADMNAYPAEVGGDSFDLVDDGNTKQYYEDLRLALAASGAGLLLASTIEQ